MSRLCSGKVQIKSTRRCDVFQRPLVCQNIFFFIPYAHAARSLKLPVLRIFWGGIISVTDKILCFRSFTAKTPKNMVTWLFPRGAVCLCSFLVYLRSGTCRRPYPSWSTKGELSDTNSWIKVLHHRKFHHLGLCWLKWRRGNFPVCDVKTVAMLRYWFCCRLQVYPLHSTVTLEEQNGVFLKPVHGFRKVKTWFFSFFMFCL